MKKTLAVLASAGVLASTLLIAAPADAASHRITFIAKSSSGTADVSYYGDGRSAVLDGRTTTWTKKVGTGGYVYSLRVSDYSGESNTVTCIIKNAKGKVVQKRTATGTSVSASCSWIKK